MKARVAKIKIAKLLWEPKGVILLTSKYFCLNAVMCLCRYSDCYLWIRATEWGRVAVQRKYSSLCDQEKFWRLVGRSNGIWWWSSCLWTLPWKLCWVTFVIHFFCNTGTNCIIIIFIIVFVWNKITQIVLLCHILQQFLNAEAITWFCRGSQLQ